MMTRCSVVALLLALGPVSVAEAASYQQVRHTLYGCADARATLALSERDGLFHKHGWEGAARRDGQCFVLKPSLSLEVIMHSYGMVLVRRVPPRVGEPPLFVMAQDLRPARVVTPRPAPVQVAVPPTSSAPPVLAPAGSSVAAAQAMVPSTSGAVVSARGPSTAAPEALPAVGQAPTLPAPAETSTATAPEALPSVMPVPIAPVPLGAPVGATPAMVPPATSVPVASRGATAASGAIPDTARPAASPPVATTQPVLVPERSMISMTPLAAPLVAAPVAQGPTLVPSLAPAPARVPTVAEPTQAPVTASAPSRGSRIGLLLGLLVTLLLLGFVGVAFLVARRRRHFTHVEEPNDWPTREEIVPLNRPTLPNPRLLPTTQEFRKRCATALETAGWKTQLTFRGNGGGPDIVARRLDAVLAVRCRMSRSAITGEMVDEAAVMGTLQAASVTVLASDAPFSQQARDEASRYRVHLLCETELSAFVG